MRKLETGFFFVVGSDAMLSSLSRPDRAARGPDDYDLRCTKYQGAKALHAAMRKRVSDRRFRIRLRNGVDQLIGSDTIR